MTTATASAQQHPEAVPIMNHTAHNYDPLNQQPAGQRSQQPGDLSSDQHRGAPQIIQSLNSIGLPNHSSKGILQKCRTLEHSFHPIMHDQTRHVISASTSEKPVHHIKCATVLNNKMSNRRTEVFDKRNMGHFSIPPKDDNITVEEKNHLFQEMSLTEQPPDQLLQEETILIERISE
ncbi:unnamed protein product [Mytilus coruscus]|uniref:Uncharacterized protein n=1 Tax=Mytilus coruscus TaxID=42192 RepID=A0A6J8CQE0_MYTCO|nr:unnamed protein product [Mytilus coruscus]